MMCCILYSELDLEDEAPPLPPRRYSWSDIEDEDSLPSDDEPDEKTSIMEHQKIYSSVSPDSIPTCLYAHNIS